MNSNEIDEALLALKREDANKLIEIAEIDTTGRAEGHVNRAFADEIIEVVMSKIIEGDYDYFLSKIEDPEFSEECLVFLCHSSMTDDIKSVIENREKLNVHERSLRELLIATKEPEYIESFLADKDKRSYFSERPQYIITLIIATNDSEYIENIVENEDIREEFGFGKDELTELITSTKNSDYIKSIIERREEFGFSKEEVATLIAGSDDAEYIKEILEDKEKIQEFGFSSNQLVDLIIATGDIEHIKEIIGSQEQLQKFGFSKNELGRLVMATKDSKYIDAYFKQYGKKNEEKADSKVNLPEDMTIGVEIESEGIASGEILELSNIIDKGWECGNDLSLSKGVEVVSPVLTGDTDKTTESIKKVCGRLETLRTDSIRYLWRAHTYRCELFN